MIGIKLRGREAAISSIGQTRSSPLLVKSLVSTIKSLNIKHKVKDQLKAINARAGKADEAESSQKTNVIIESKQNEVESKMEEKKSELGSLTANGAVLNSVTEAMASLITLDVTNDDLRDEKIEKARELRNSFTNTDDLIAAIRKENDNFGIKMDDYCIEENGKEFSIDDERYNNLNYLKWKNEIEKLELKIPNWNNKKIIKNVIAAPTQKAPPPPPETHVFEAVTNTNKVRVVTKRLVRLSHNSQEKSSTQIEKNVIVTITNVESEYEIDAWCCDYDPIYASPSTNTNNIDEIAVTPPISPNIPNNLTDLEFELKAKDFNKIKLDIDVKDMVCKKLKEVKITRIFKMRNEDDYNSVSFTDSSDYDSISTAFTELKKNLNDCSG